MAKYYFFADAIDILVGEYDEPDETKCYTRKYFNEYMKKNKLSEVEVIEAEIEYDSGFFYCKAYGECFEVGTGCGRECPKYEPRNGKGGRCRFSNNTYIHSNKRLTLKLPKNYGKNNH